MTSLGVEAEDLQVAEVHDVLAVAVGETGISPVRTVEGLALELGGPETLAVVLDGIPGPPGHDGANGAGSVADLAYTHDQSTPSDTWTIVHGLGFRPAGVRVVDTLGRNAVGVLAYPDVNTVTVSFNAPFSGTAYLS